MTHPPAPLTERGYVLPLVLVTSLFFLWAIGVNLNDVLIPHLKKAFALTDFQSSFIQVAFFGGYFLGALPAGRLMEKIGYKGGILVGLLICAVGALLFIPASIIGAYGFFLFALFVMSSGQSFLEVGANPYVTVLGPSESSERRLNFAQSFNAVGAQVGVGSFVIRFVKHTMPVSLEKTAGWLVTHKGTGGFLVRLSTHIMPDTLEKLAAVFLVAHQVGFMIGRFSGAAMMKRVPAPKLLAVFGAGALVCVAIGITASGLVPVVAIVMVRFLNLIILLTIFALRLKNLGPLTKRGSSLLVMSIIGGALIPAAMGRISDLSTIQVAFIVPLICYVYVFYFAKWGFRPVAPGAAN